MGIRITTDDFGVKVWRSDKYGFPQYAVRISKKLDNGEYINEYQAVRFRKGVELANGDEIYINDAFDTLEVWPDKQTGETKHKRVWQILDFSYRARQESVPPSQRQMPAQQRQDDTTQLGGVQASFSDLPDSFSAAEDDIPF